MGESERIEHEAAAWLARRDRADWSAREQRAFAAWCDAATAHRVAYLRLDAAWKAADRLKAIGAGVVAGDMPAPGEWNWSRFNSPEFETLYNQASSELDPAKRRQEIIECQKLMDKNSAFVWLTNEASAVISRSWLKPASIPGWIDWQYADFSAA